MSIVPSNEYLLVMPSGNVRGFNEYGMAKAYINNYLYHITRSSEGIIRELNDLTANYENLVDTVCRIKGAEQGECKLYYTNDVIEKIQQDFIFDDEKQEVISKLLADCIEFNTYDYSIDNILNDIEPIDIMEQYGNPITGE